MVVDWAVVRGCGQVPVVPVVPGGNGAVAGVGREAGVCRNGAERLATRCGWRWPSGPVRCGGGGC